MKGTRYPMIKVAFSGETLDDLISTMTKMRAAGVSKDERYAFLVEAVGDEEGEAARERLRRVAEKYVTITWGDVHEPQPDDRRG